MNLHLLHAAYDSGNQSMSDKACALTTIKRNNKTMNIYFKEFRKGCAKGLLMMLNAFCILVSLCTFGFAVADIRILKQYGADRAAGTFAGDMIILFACLLLFAIAIFGCVGAARENVKILYLYVGLLMVLVLMELMIGIFVTVQRCGLEFKMTDWLREDFFKNYTSDELTEHNRIWDDLQMNYECCGLNGPEDYAAFQRPISVSCCPRAYRARSEHAQDLLYKSCIESSHYYNQGCEEEILHVLRSDGDYLLGIAVVSFWCEAAAMLLAMWIANNLKNCVQVYKHTVKY